MCLRFLTRGRKRVRDRRRDGLGFAGWVRDDREPALLLRGVLAHGQQHQGVEALCGHRQRRRPHARPRGARVSGELRIGIFPGHHVQGKGEEERREGVYGRGGLGEGDVFVCFSSSAVVWSGGGGRVCWGPLAVCEGMEDETTSTKERAMYR